MTLRKRLGGGSFKSEGSRNNDAGVSQETVRIVFLVTRVIGEGYYAVESLIDASMLIIGVRAVANTQASRSNIGINFQINNSS